eukprot:5425198-Amphidinium_carterae.1
MYGGESSDSNAVLCVASDPPPEPIWGAFKQLLQVRPSLDAFRQLMSTMKAESVTKDVAVLMAKSLELLKFAVDVVHFHTAMEVAKAMQRLEINVKQAEVFACISEKVDQLLLQADFHLPRSNPVLKTHLEVGLRTEICLCPVS